MNNEPLFKSAHDALTFAFNFSGQQYERPLVGKLAAPGTGSGKGLSGNDGAGQAGMIRREIQELGRLAESIITVRFAPRVVPCECRSTCCRGCRDNVEWVNAVAYLADHMRMDALAGTRANAVVRRECVVRYLTPKEKRGSIDQMAEACNINRDTASAYIRKVALWFSGSPERNGKPAVIGREQIAMGAIEDRLQHIGMVGN